MSRAKAIVRAEWGHLEVQQDSYGKFQVVAIGFNGHIKRLSEFDDFDKTLDHARKLRKCTFESLN